MAFILKKDLDPVDDIPALTAGWDEYRAYLKGLRGKIPDSAYEFANADWHSNYDDARCPHDAWLEDVKFGEVGKNDGKYGLKSFDIYVLLLGAYHNGHIELTYRNVYHYEFGLMRRQDNDRYIKSALHGDWLSDEIRLSDDENVIHEIGWAQANWLIECGDIEYKWLPFNSDESPDMTEKK